jgi:hypothetical protein
MEKPMALTPETLSHYGIGALSAMSDLMAEILDKIAPQHDSRAKFVKELGDLQVLIDHQLNFDLEAMSGLYQVQEITSHAATKVKVIQPEFAFEKQPGFIIEIFRIPNGSSGCFSPGH